MELAFIEQKCETMLPVTEVTKYIHVFWDVESVFHMSLGKSGRLWISDFSGNFVKTCTDLCGYQLREIQTNGEVEGYHTVTRGGDLIYAICQTGTTKT